MSSPLSMNLVCEGSVGLYPKFESLHADLFDWWEPCYHLGDGYWAEFSKSNDNYGMGSTIGVIPILTMFITMWVTKERRERWKLANLYLGLVFYPLPAYLLLDYCALMLVMIWIALQVFSWTHFENHVLR